MPIETELLPDHVWQQLDSRAGWLTSADLRLARRLAVVGVLVAALLIAVWQSGALGPRLLSGQGSYGTEADTLHHTFVVQVEVRNSGWTEARIDGIGRNGQGLRLVSVDATFPSDVPQSTGQLISLTYEVTDCSAVPQGDWPIPVRVARPWGDVTSWIHLRPTVPMSGAPTGMRAFSGRDPYAKEWQASLATDACAPISAGPDTPANAG